MSTRKSREHGCRSPHMTGWSKPRDPLMVLRQAVEMARPRGTVFMKSTVHGKVPLDTAPVIVHEISLVGSRCGRFEPALNLLAAGRIQVADMISEALPLSKAPAALRLRASPVFLKVLSDRALKRVVIPVLASNSLRYNLTS